LDVLVAADWFVQSQLTSNMQRLASRVVNQPVNWHAGSSAGIHQNNFDHNAEWEQGMTLPAWFV